MELVYLKEQRPYTEAELVATIRNQLGLVQVEWVDLGFCRRMAEAMNFVKRGTNKRLRKTQAFVFYYIGIFDFIDSKGENCTFKNVTFYFAPKFIDVQNRDLRPAEGIRDKEEDLDALQNGRDAVLLSIDRWHREEAKLGDQFESSEEKRESILELAVRFMRDYLEKGPYVVSRHELERNGPGEIDWETTITQYQPALMEEDPLYMDYDTHQAFPDENYYVTRLQACLVTHWGRKLEELGLATVLRVNVPLLSEDALDRFGDEDYQVVQIIKELGAQFVSSARETLFLMKELIERETETREIGYESLSFGMAGGDHLWEAACAKVFGSELDRRIKDCGIAHLPPGMSDETTFRAYMPHVKWRRGTAEANEAWGDETLEDVEEAVADPWRLDFIRTWKNGDYITRLVILDAKYYYAKWSEDGRHIERQPGTPDVAKQIFYQMVFKDLVEANPLPDERKIGFVNAFLIPLDDSHDGDEVVPVARENVEWERALSAFSEVKLRAVRVPGLELLRQYGNWQDDNREWFASIVNVD